MLCEERLCTNRQGTELQRLFVNETPDELDDEGALGKDLPQLVMPLRYTKITLRGPNPRSNFHTTLLSSVLLIVPAPRMCQCIANTSCPLKCIGKRGPLPLTF